MTDTPKPTAPNLPEFLAMTEEQIAVSNQIQAQVRQVMLGRVEANQQEARLIHGIQMEQAARDNLTVLDTHAPVPGLPDRIKLNLARLADGLAEQGRYDEAAAIHPDETTAGEYMAIQIAIERPDDDLCDHQPDEVTDPASGQTLRIPARTHVADVYNPRVGRVVPLVRCSKCPPGKELNARPLTSTGTLIKRERARASVKQVPLTRADLEKPVKDRPDAALLK